MLEAIELHEMDDCKVEVGFIKAEEASFMVCKTRFSVCNADFIPEEMRFDVQESAFNCKAAEIEHEKMSFRIQNEFVNVQASESAVFNRLNRRWKTSILR